VNRTEDSAADHPLAVLLPPSIAAAQAKPPRHRGVDVHDAQRPTQRREQLQRASMRDAFLSARDTLWANLSRSDSVEWTRNAGACGTPFILQRLRRSSWGSDLILALGAFDWRKENLNWRPPAPHEKGSPRGDGQDGLAHQRGRTRAGAMTARRPP
jgi:hypothetical protein